MGKISLENVTLCAATSVNTDATLQALRASLEQIDFAECLFFTDARVVPGDKDIRVIPIPKLSSSRDYSEFMLRALGNYIRTPHCLVIQWDGFVIDAGQWDPEFLNFDYIGAPWPQFDDACNVGNGGFSLRSQNLLSACRDDDFIFEHPEDIAICRTNRSLLEKKHNIRFADCKTAARFAFERRSSSNSTFGFHGVFNMIPVLGPDRFFQIYRKLDDRSTAVVDFRTLFRQLGAGRSAFKRRMRLTWDAMISLFRG